MKILSLLAQSESKPQKFSQYCSQSVGKHHFTQKFTNFGENCHNSIENNDLMFTKQVGTLFILMTEKYECGAQKSVKEQKYPTNQNQEFAFELPFNSYRLTAQKDVCGIMIYSVGEFKAKRHQIFTRMQKGCLSLFLLRFWEKNSGPLHG
ncbi:UNKNOWN [Stylonychia lemnae]|uniref:Uncharacterized protein n=1 Tax=Stylonychia lemnae TaxID=5949 RepID=A0A078B3R0_STYLE|nr:UNKNOWN [Stylonychia lemnae]|eukprot:CDW87857.1 UNKNOWN [Stylonychia lemnae]